jgi:hypothetical protein
VEFAQVERIVLDLSLVTSGMALGANLKFENSDHCGCDYNSVNAPPQAQQRIL